MTAVLFPERLHEPIRSGRVTVAFRRWKRPTVSEGGTLQTPGGLLHVDELTAIDETDIVARDAVAAGCRDVDEVIDALHEAEGRTLYRIRFHRIGDDPRVALRDDDLTDDDVARIDDQLDRWDAASTSGPWTSDLLGLIAARPAEPSRVLAAEAGTDQPRLKRRIRQLKGLGLTESLDTG